MTSQLLIVTVDGQRLGVDLGAVKEIIDRCAVTSLPRLPRAIAGVIEVRGAAIPLIDAGAIIGLPAHLDRRSIVVATDGTRPIALLVDDIEGIVDSGDAGDVAMLDLQLILEAIE